LRSEPILSVLTPSYQYAQFIEECVDSVRVPGHRLEHIVADGGSTDGTTELLRSRPPSRDVELVWWSRPDLGQSDALNQALAMARGQWVGWLNADEFYLTEGLSTVCERLATTSADVVTAECLFVDAHGRPIRLLGSARPTAFSFRRYGWSIASCCTFFRREVLGASPWDVTFSRFMDWDLFLTLVDRGAEFEFLPVTASCFRIHEGQITADPAELLSEERQAVRSKHGIPTGPASVRIGYLAGRVGRVVAKARSGAYRRERTFRRALDDG